MIPTYTITDQQISDLCQEAAIAGDFAMVQICKRALRGSLRARATCSQVIADARAQMDD